MILSEDWSNYHQNFKCHPGRSFGFSTKSRLGMNYKHIKPYTISLFLILNLKLITTNAQSNQDPAERHLIGVQSDKIGYYKLSKDQNFTCLDRSRSIPMSFVNDDYCDCSDASDEPGTSACPHGRFFCANAGYIQRLIPSAWVNDGQCDCCDASDEYNSKETCENTCRALGEIYREEQERNREISDKGSAIRSQYKEQAKLRRDQNTQLLSQYKMELSEKENAIKRLEEELNSDYGPNQVFIPLKGKCFSFKEREYTYTLCPFERATQESTSGDHTELGRWAGWVGSADNPYSAQKYEGGIQCWNGPARSALVSISCGAEDKITSVNEPSKCEYFYNFITPAACPDLDPPEESTLEQEQTTQATNVENADTDQDNDSLDTYPDEYNDTPDGDSSPPDVEKHDEL